MVNLDGTAGVSGLSKSELKERERKTWAQVAKGWKKRDEMLREGSAPVTERMLELAGIDTGHWVLDIASGTGEPAIAAAHKAGETGKIIGTDLIEDMLDFAREKANKANLGNIEFRCVDGEELDFESSRFDAATIRWGLMFMPDPVACLRQVYRVLKKNGRVVVACWAAPERNPFISLVMKVLRNYMEVPKPPPGAPGIFAFADPDRLRSVMESAGFANIEIEEMELDVMVVDSGADYWSAVEDMAGPVVVLVNRLDNETRSAFVREVIETADALKNGDTLKMGGTTWIASGTRL